MSLPASVPVYDDYETRSKRTGMSLEVRFNVTGRSYESTGVPKSKSVESDFEVNLEDGKKSRNTRRRKTGSFAHHVRSCWKEE